MTTVTSTCQSLTGKTSSCSIFGQGGPFGGFGGFGDRGFGEEEEQTPKGNNVYVELEVTLKDLFLGNTFTVRQEALPPGTFTLLSRLSILLQLINIG